MKKLFKKSFLFFLKWFLSSNYLGDEGAKDLGQGFKLLN
jgi:hypothetical protein